MSHSLSHVLCASTQRLAFSLFGQNPSCSTLVPATLAHKETSSKSQKRRVNKYARVHRTLLEFGALWQFAAFIWLSARNCRGKLRIFDLLYE